MFKSRLEKTILKTAYAEKKAELIKTRLANIKQYRDKKNIGLEHYLAEYLAQSIKRYTRYEVAQEKYKLLIKQDTSVTKSGVATGVLAGFIYFTYKIIDYDPQKIVETILDKSQIPVFDLGVATGVAIAIPIIAYKAVKSLIKNLPGAIQNYKEISANVKEQIDKIKDRIDVNTLVMPKYYHKL